MWPDGAGRGGDGVEVRVLLFEGAEASITCRGGGYGLRKEGESEAWVVMGAKRECQVRRREGKWQVSDGTGKTLAAGGDAIEVGAEHGKALWVGEDEMNGYRGRLRLAARGKDRFAVVNVVEMEDYLAGVVGAEMYPYWHMAALRAQSIVSRTYALHRIAGRKGQGQWDIVGSRYGQVYGGIKQESERVAQAVGDTRGTVLTYEWQGEEKVFPTYYSSVCGGHTQSAAGVFGEGLRPLRGQVCPYCRATARPELYRWGPIRIAKEVVSQRLIARYPTLGELGSIVGIEMVGKSNHGRAEVFKLRGSSGKRKRIRAVELRLALTTEEAPLRSSWYRLADDREAWRFEEGRGFGHGVGLCQYGSEQMARLGKDCVEIVEHYYPGTSLARAY